MSDRGAIALARSRFDGDVRAYAADADARCFARAAGVEAVDELSVLQVSAVDVALIGRGACVESGDLLPAQLAEEGGAALIFDVIDVRRESDRLLVTRDLGRGARDLLGVSGRAVLVIAESVERGPYVSRYRMNAARTAAGELGAREAGYSDREWEFAKPRARLGDHGMRVAGSAVERMNALFGAGEIADDTASLVQGSAEECARQLVRYLSHHGFVERESILGSDGVAGEVGGSQPTAQSPSQTAEGVAPIPIRASRRPRPVEERPRAMRGPFEVGVDI